MKMGYVKLFCDLDNIKKIDNPLENLPDVYMVVKNGKYLGYRFKILKDIQVLYADPVTAVEHSTKDLGCIKVGLTEKASA